MATYISRTNGDWSSVTTWLTAAAGTLTPTANAGQPPQSGAGDQIIIKNGNIVTYDVIGEFGNDGSYFTNSNAKTLLNAIVITDSGSTLKAHRTISTSLSVRGSLVVDNNCSFDWGTVSDPVVATSAELVFGTASPALLSSTQVVNSITVALSTRSRCGLFTRTPSDATKYHKISFCGISKTRNAFLNGIALAGTTTLTSTDVTGWLVGDRITIEPHTVDSSIAGYSVNLPTLSSARISNIIGNVVTIDKPLPFTYQSGLAIGNFSNNITYKTGLYYVNTSTFLTPFAFGPFFTICQNISGIYDIRNVTFENVQQATADNENIVPNTWGMISHDLNGGLSPFNVDNVAIWQDKNYISTSFFGTFGKTGTSLNSYKNLALHSAEPVLGAPGFYSRFGPSYSLQNSVFYRVGTSIFSDQTNSDQILINNLRVNSRSGSLFTSVFNNLKVNNSNFRYIPNPIVGLNFCAKMTFTDCNFYSSVNTFVRPIEAGTGSWGTVTFNNCILSGMWLPEPLTSGLTYNTSKESAFNLYNYNKNPIDNRRYNTYYSLISDYTNRNRGLASYKVKSSNANNAYYVTETVAGFAGDTKRFIGYIKYDSSYGNINLPYISFVDASLTVTQTFSCQPIPNSWQKFDLSITPVTNGDITMSLVGLTSSTTANVYLDGISFFPISPKARHYGFVTDDSVPYRTTDTITTLTENQVSSYPAINNLDYLYDVSTYWSVTNPTLTSYIDLYTKSGAIALDFGTKSIILDDTVINNFNYSSSLNNITLKTPMLSSGNKLNDIKTSSNIYLSGSSNIYNISVLGNIISEPKNITKVNATNISYNTNTPTTITYTNCQVDNLSNIGTGLVSVIVNGSTVTNVTGNIVLVYNPTYLNITSLNGGYISIFDETGALRYYVNSDQIITLPSGSNGLWTYKIGRYNYKTIENSFAVSTTVGLTINISPTYVYDSFVYESNAATASSYSKFDNVQKVYDYLSYFRTTITGLSGYSSSDFYSYRSTLDIINNDLVLNVNAPNLFSYDGKTLTLSSNKLEAGAIIKGIETSNNIYLSGSAMLSGLSVTVGKGLYIEKAYDLYDTNVYVGTIAYYEDIAPVSIIYTNCNVNKVVNNGSKTITITRINSTIIDATDAEIATTVPITINISASVDTYVAIYKPDGTRYHYGNGNVTKILGGDAVTGNWTYKIYRYGYVGRTGSFFIDANVASTTTIIGTGLLTDTGITENNPAIVSAYTDLNSTFKIYDYLSYYKTTSNGIDIGDIATKAIGSLFINTPLTLDATASNVLDYQSTPSVLLTLKCSGLSEHVDLYVTGDFLNINGTTLSKDVHIRSTNLDSEIELIGINEIKFFQTDSDRDNNLNVGPIFTLVDIIRFKHGNVYSGVTFSGLMRVRVDVGSTLLYSFPITIGNNLLDLGTFGQIQQVLNAQKTMNTGIQKASKLIPYSTNI